MIDLTKFFSLVFHSPRISRECLKDFVEDHIQRLTAHNPGGIFNAQLAAVQVAYASYFGHLSGGALHLAQQEGRTLALAEGRAKVEQLLNDNEKLIAYTYREAAAVYEEFYPLGLSEYYRAGIDAFLLLGQRFQSVLNAHASDFDPAVLTEYTTALAQLQTTRTEQLSEKGKVAGERSLLRTERKALEAQLTKNLLFIAYHFSGDVGKASVYFNQPILDSAFRIKKRKLQGDIDPGATLTLFDNIAKASVKLLLRNTGTRPLVLGFAPRLDAGPPTVRVVKLLPNQTIVQTAGELGWSSTHPVLRLANLGPLEGSYFVQKI